MCGLFFPSIALDRMGQRSRSRYAPKLNPLWGAPRIHGELLKLGLDVSERTVSRYILRHPKPPSQTWRTFLENHVGCLASMDLFVVPTAAFRLLYGFIILRRDLAQAARRS